MKNQKFNMFNLTENTVPPTNLEKIFEKHFRKGQRVGMAFLTADGKATSKLMGIITPWDMIGKE